MKITKQSMKIEHEVMKYLKIIPNLPLIKNDTDNVIEYNSGYEENNNENNKKRFGNYLK